MKSSHENLDPSTWIVWKQTFFCKISDSKYFKVCKPDVIYYNYSIPSF